MASATTVVDLFCGAGGFSTGVALACEQLGQTPGDDVEIHAINHWEPAIETHETNHSWAEHYHAKIEELHPPDVVEPGTVDLLVGGPECVHFSRARGGKPVREQKRASAWHVLDWVEKLRPENVLLENVPPFRDWGPVVDGQPTRDGSIFEQWVGMFEALGYTVEYRTLNAADYGDPTSRERLFIVASRTKQPTFPQPTHSAEDDDDLADHRPAAEIIDWADPGGSIFTRDIDAPRKKPLKNSTMQRIAEGIRQHCPDRYEPLADALATLGRDDVRELRSNRVVSLEEAATVAQAVDEPFLVRCPTTGGVGLSASYLLRQQDGASPVTTNEPVPTIATRGGHQKVEARPLVMPRNGFQRGLHSNPLYRPGARPLHTVTAKNTDGYRVSPTLLRYSHGGATLDIEKPLPTITTAKGGVFGLGQSYLCPLYNGRSGQQPRTRSIERPLMTVPASKSPAGVASPFLVDYHGQSDAGAVDEPLGAVETRDRFALCVPEAWPWGLDVRYRMLNPQELKQAQGFPAEYDICGSTKKAVTEQIGNAVPVHLATALCQYVLASENPSLSTYGGGISEEPNAEVPDYEEVNSAD
ncbi:DNA (cytosine-5)-methyltransferase 1 [Halorientalis persicus]|uniref:DNA (cytosine-5-)-methyltransferase n=1 Tax=Halorientalis persicus TaxID=1367881 RepID=A0A1H8Q1T0_9EURY|nr:DNA cytosine methyltransferase [Halorientalis persicus]SEO48179.1 DNA (cytosine-5)-methyltransferase 1 [Halorientalis persicus]